MPYLFSTHDLNDQVFDHQRKNRMTSSQSLYPSSCALHLKAPDPFRILAPDRAHRVSLIPRTNQKYFFTTKLTSSFLGRGTIMLLDILLFHSL